jgi:hypothetical protein
MFNQDCAVCRSPNQAEIDEALARGRSHDGIANQFDLQESDVFQHCEHTIRESASAERDSQPETLLENLRRNAARLELRIVQAQIDDDLTAQARCSAELTKNLALQNEIANRQLTDGASSETAQIRSLARKMVSALSQSPEMKSAISDALKEHFGEDDWHYEE